MTEFTQLSVNVFSFIFLVVNKFKSYCSTAFGSNIKYIAIVLKLSDTVFQVVLVAQIS